MRVVVVALLAALALTGTAQAVRFMPDADLEFRNEPGVETKLMLRGVADVELASWADAFGGVAFAVGDNPGVAHYGLGISASEGEAKLLGFRVQVNHDNWSGIRTGENRLVLAIEGRPFPSLDLAAGVAHRAPIFDSSLYGSPFVWKSDAPEWNYLYRVDWTFLRRKIVPGSWFPVSGTENQEPGTTLALGVWLQNFDELTAHTPQQFPFGLRGRLDTTKHWHANVQVGTDIKNLSGLLLSMGELDIRAGGGYEF